MDGQLRTGLTAFACTDLLHGGATVSLVGIVGTSMRQDAKQIYRTVDAPGRFMVSSGVEMKTLPVNWLFIGSVQGHAGLVEEVQVQVQGLSIVYVVT